MAHEKPLNKPYRLKFSTVAIWGFFFLLFSVTVANAITVPSSRPIIIALRLTFFVISVLSFFLLFVKVKNFPTVTIYAVICLSIFLIYGIFLSLIFGGSSHVSEGLATDVLILFSCTVAVSVSSSYAFSRPVLIFFVIMCFAVLVITFFIGGFDLSYPPHFKFTALSHLSISDILYSQGISKFYGLASIISMAVALSVNSISKTISGILISLGFLFLSFIGGGRGDVIAVSIVLLIYSFSRYPKTTFLITICVIVFSILFLGNILLQDFIAFQRFMYLSEAVSGIRLTLAEEGILLFDEMPICFFSGCGFGYFQKFYNYVSGLYPHNVILEMLITHGFIFNAVFMTFCAKGSFEHIKTKGFDVFFAVFLFFLLIAMKSGTILSSYFFGGYIMYFFSSGMIHSGLVINRDGRRFSEGLQQ